MKKTLKSVLAVVLAVIMTFSCICVAFAKEEKTPVVLIPGFGQSETLVYDDDGTYLGDLSIFDLPTLDIADIVLDVVIPLIKSVAARKDVSLSEAVSQEMSEVFKAYLKNDDGTPKYKTVVREFNAAYSKLSAEDRAAIDSNVSMRTFSDYDDVRYYFTYDSFGSIKNAAERLHDYIHNVVLAQTGADKITLVPVSQGGTVLIQYLEMYPEDYQYIKKIVAMIPAFDGSELVGDIVTDNVNIYDVDYLYDTILPSLLGESDTTYAAIMGLRLALSEEATVPVLKAALAGAVDCLIKRSTMMWALSPAHCYEEGAALYLSDDNLSAIRAENEAYNQARENFPSNLQTLIDNGVIVHSIVSYDVGLFLGELFGSNEKDADDLLAPSSPSLGATAAKLGSTLGDDYVSPHTYCSNPAHNHISPDNKIDASTGYLPENTWYFKGVSHQRMNGREDVKRFAVELIVDDSITDIYSSEGHSQFTNPKDNIAESVVSGGRTYYYDKDGNYMYSEATPDTAEEETKTEITFIGVIYNIFNFFWKLMKNLFKIF